MIRMMMRMIDDKYDDKDNNGDDGKALRMRMLVIISTSFPTFSLSSSCLSGGGAAIVRNPNFSSIFARAMYIANSHKL